jgi:hypothetical protein
MPLQGPPPNGPPLPPGVLPPKGPPPGPPPPGVPPPPNRPGNFIHPPVPFPDGSVTIDVAQGLVDNTTGLFTQTGITTVTLTAAEFRAALGVTPPSIPPPFDIGVQVGNYLTETNRI